MGWVTMSERDLQRIEVLTDVLAGRRTVAAAATVLAVGERQMYRLLAKYEDGGGSALIHKARGKTSKPEPERRHPQICSRAGQDSIR
jgi:transposase